MPASIAATFYQIGYADMLARQMEQKQIDAIVLTPQEYADILSDKARNNPRLAATLHAMLAHSALGRYWTHTASPNAGKPWVAPASLMVSDAYLITKTLIALGLAGARSYIKTTATGTYIIITGYAGLRRQLLQGTRFLAANPRMVQMGLGIRGLQNVAKGGFLLSLVVGTGIETLDFIFNDEKTMHDLVGGIGVEAVKAGLATMIAISAGALTASVTTLVIFPLGAMALAIFATGALLNYTDQRWKIKQNVITALKSVNNEKAPGIYKLDQNPIQ
ncbi:MULTISPECIES: hypothetical protein [Delftia]|uniref:hypothetical protein n=1 Tax=Delftia TaxID=80865 RepID=UPI0004D94FD2|nr:MULTISPECIES: hypothetical protein [Delftia]KEH14299.1 hypothetical protein GY15_06490 [Delftia sp. 670]MBD9583176.1 hypothetical protein [Delftia sp. DLF01]MDH0422074.1 hypothetical protein [Delftia tsuruhatensis]MPT05528.1 hypothetical protein [Delftia sp.]OJX11602.1 MAG: hypothetical protein BGO79_28715 [Delftia sp. 67-8]